METPLIVRRNMLRAIITAVAMSLLPAIPVMFWIFAMPEHAFNLELFGGILIVLLLSVVPVMCWIVAFDRKPMLMIDEKGIWRRKGVLSQSELCLMPFENIKSWCIQRIKNGNREHYTLYLTVVQKDEPLPVNIDLDVLNITEKAVSETLRGYNSRYQTMHPSIEQIL